MYLGIDGGQTKTEGVIIDNQGNLIVKACVEGMPHQGELNDESHHLFSSLVQNLCSEASVKTGDITMCAAGLCGIDNPEDFPRQLNSVKSFLSLPEEKIILVNDALVALWGATAHPAALLMQHGTAFTSAIRYNHDKTFLFDSYDIGRIYDIRDELLAKTARMIDGRLAETALKKAVLDFFDIQDQSLYNYYIDYEVIPRSKQLQTAGLIFNFWQNNDPVASHLVMSALEDYILMIKIMINKMNEEEIEVILGGGILKRAPDSFYSLMEEKLKPLKRKMTVKRPEMSPVMGAAVMAGVKAGLNPVDFYRKVKNSLLLSGE